MIQWECLLSYTFPMPENLSDTAVSTNKKNTEAQKLKDTLEFINKEHTFHIIQITPSKYTIQHTALDKPIPFNITSIGKALELRNFIEREYVKDKSCIDRESLAQCVLIKSGPGDYHRADTGRIARYWMVPDLSSVDLPIDKLDTKKGGQQLRKDEITSYLAIYRNDAMQIEKDTMIARK